MARYTEAIALDQSCFFYNNRSLAHFYLGNYTEALADSLQALALNDEPAKFHVNAAKCCEKQGDISAARRHYEAALTKDARHHGAQVAVDKLREVNHASRITHHASRIAHHAS